MDKVRCDWSVKDALNQAYHDEEWGVPLFARVRKDDQVKIIFNIFNEL